MNTEEKTQTPVDMTTPPPTYAVAIDPANHPKALEAYGTPGSVIVQQPQPVCVGL